MFRATQSNIDIECNRSHLQEIFLQDNPVLYGALAKRAVRALIEHFHQNLGDQIVLQDMAEEIGCSTFGLIRAFRRLTGITPMRYLSILRLAEAKRMLLTTDLNVISICYEVGYESLGSFNNRFKALVGLTPTGLRKLQTTLDPKVLLRDCFYGYGTGKQLRATAYFKSSGLYAELVDLRLTNRFEIPAPGLIAVVFAIPWSEECDPIFLPEEYLRSEPIEIDNATSVGSLQRVHLRLSTDFDPPVLPVLAAGSIVEQAEMRLAHF